MNKLVELAQKIEMAEEVRFNETTKEIEVIGKDKTVNGKPSFKIGVKEWLFQMAAEYQEFQEALMQMKSREPQQVQKPKTKSTYKAVFVHGEAGANIIQELLNTGYDVTHSETCAEGILVVLEKEVPLED